MDYYTDKHGSIDVGDSYFMGYHIPLKKPSDWYESLKFARWIAENITVMINQQESLNGQQITVFPYRSVAYYVLRNYRTLPSFYHIYNIRTIF